MRQSHFVSFVLQLLVLVSLKTFSFAFSDGITSIQQRLHDQLSPALLKVTFDLLKSHDSSLNQDDVSAETEEPLDLVSHRFEPSTPDFNRSQLWVNDEHKQEIEELDDSDLFNLPSMFGQQPLLLKRSKRHTGSISPLPSQPSILAHHNKMSQSSVPQLDLNIPTDPPTFASHPSSFMHSFVSGSGVGNRELVRITSIAEQPLQVLTPQPTLGWQYARFNSSDYVAGRQKSFVYVWRQQFAAGARSFRFDEQSAICRLQFVKPSEVLHTLFYTRVINDEELLHLAVTIRTVEGVFQLRTYELVANSGRSGCLPSLTVELGNSPPVRLVHLKSHYFGALAVLMDSGARGTPLITHLQNGKETSANVLAVRVQGPVDLEPFNMHGFAYLAVAYTNGVDIFKFDEFIQRHQTYENIPLADVRDVLAFQLGVEHHLALATGGVYQHLFVWRDGSFVRQQVLRVTRALQWLPLRVHTCRDDLFVGLLRDDSSAPLLLYQWNTATRRLQLESDSLQHFLTVPLNPLAFGQTTFSYNATAFLLQPDAASARTRLIAFDTVLEQLPDPLFERQFQLSNFIRSLHARLTAQQMSLRVVRDTLDHAVGAFGRPAVVLLPAHLRELRSAHSVQATNIEWIGSARWQGTSLTLEDAAMNITGIRNLLVSLKGQVASLSNQIRQRAVFVRSPQVQLAGRKQFFGSTIVDTLNARSLDLERVANTSLTALVGDLWLRDHALPLVQGLKRFVHPLTISGQLQSLLFNGRQSPFEYAITTNTPAVIRSPVEFAGDLISGELLLDQRVNKLNLSSDLIWIDAPPHFEQIITSPIQFTFSPLSIYHLRTPSINLVDVLRLRQQSLTVDLRQTISTPLKIDVVKLYAPSNARLNGFDLHQVANSLVRQDRPTLIEAPKLFANTLQVNVLIVLGLINGLQVPAQLVSRTRPQDIYGRKQIPSLQFRNHLTVQRYLNHIRYPMDVITLTLNEDLHSPVVFGRGFSAAGDIHVSGLTDGLQLAKFARYMNRREMVLFGQTRFEGPIYVRGDLHVDGLIAGQNFTWILEQLLLRGQPIFESTGVKKFVHPVVFAAGLSTPTLNQVPTKLLVDTRMETIIQTPVHFRSASFDRLYVSDDRINNLDMSSLLRDRIALHQPGPIIGNKHFESIAVDAVIRVHGSLNGLKPERDFVFVNGVAKTLFAPDGTNVGQTIQFVNSSLVEFSKDVRIFGDLVADRLTLNGRLANVNVSKLLQDRIPLDQEVHIPFSVIIGDNRASKLVLKDKQMLNGRNFAFLLRNWMRNDEPQVVSGRKHFLAPIRFDAPSKLEHLNNVTISQLLESSLRTAGDQTISGDLIVLGPLRVSGSLETSRGLNGIKLSDLHKDIPRIDQPIRFVAPCQFDYGLRVGGWTQARLVNGLRLPDDVLLLHADQWISGEITFEKVFVNGGIRSRSGLLNRVLVGALDEQAIRSDRPNVLPGDLIVDQPVYAFGDVQIRGQITNVNLTRLISHTLSRHGNQRLTRLTIDRNSPVTFGQLRASRVNGVSLNEFIRDVVFASGVNQQQDFGNGKSFRRIKLQGNFRLAKVDAQCLINGLDLHLLQHQRIPLTSRHPIHINATVRFVKRVYFNDMVNVLQRINGVDLQRDVLRLNALGSPQLIRGLWALERAHFDKNLVLGGAFNGHTIRHLLSTTLFRQGDQEITGVKQFKQMLRLGAGLDVSVLNKNSLAWQQAPFVRLDNLGDQPVRFVQPLHVLGNLHVLQGLLANVNLTEWIRYSLRISPEQHLTAQLHLDRSLVAGSFWPRGPVNGIDLINLMNRLNQFEHSLNNDDLWLKQQLAKQLKLSRDLLAYVRHSSLQVIRFELDQTLPGIFGQKVSANPLGIFDLHLGFQPLRFESHPTVAGGRFTSGRSSLNATFANNGLNEPHYYKRQLMIGEESRSSLQLLLPPPEDGRPTLINSGDKLLASLGLNVDSVRHLHLSDGHTLIGALSGISGQLALHMLRSPLVHNSPTPSVHALGQLGVGAEAVDFVLFEMEKEVYVAVARAYGHLCPLSDLGTLVFRWHERRTFQLVQRLPLADATLIQHVEFNQNHYLLVYESDPPGDDQMLSGGKLHVYRRKGDLKRCQFILMQQLSAPNLIQLTPFAFGPSDRLQMYLLGLSVGRLHIWRYAGHSGFRPAWTLELAGGAAVRPLLLNQQLYLMVAQDRDCGTSRVYRAVTNGAAQVQLELRSLQDGTPSQWQTQRLIN